MKRRDVLTGLGALGVAACAGESPAPATAAQTPRATTYKWKMVTTWPPNFPGLGTGAANLARYIGETTGGRVQVKVYAGGELVPPFEVFDAVSRGTAELGHSVPYYWKGKVPAAQLFSGVPFGMNALQMSGWLRYGGGLELWREVYEPFNVIPVIAGHTGVQMGGWFNREINGVGDLKGLKMRIPGLGGEVLRRAGGTPVSLPGAEIFTALQTGSIDATEWVGPYNDLAFGLHQAAKYYYYPGWHEPDGTIECLVNAAAMAELPAELQTAVVRACDAAATDMVAEFTARNHRSLEVLLSEHAVQLRPYPPAVLSELRRLSGDVLGEMAAGDEKVARILSAYREFQQKVSAWHDVSEKAYFNATGA